MKKRAIKNSLVVICTLFTGQSKSIKEGFFIRYSYEFKRTCVKLYRKGLWADTPEGISTDKFHETIRTWVRIEDACGSDALRHKNQNKYWTLEERYKLVSRVLTSESIQSVAISVGINSGMLY